MNDSSTPTAPTTGSIVDFNAIISRVQEMLLNPKDTWQKIHTESSSPKDIYAKYLVPLALAGGLCAFVGESILGGRPFFGGVIFNVVAVALKLVMLYVSALAVSLLAGKFDGKSDESRAFQLVSYSMTASLVGQMLTIIPALIPVTILFSLYSLYTMYVGIPLITGVPVQRRIPFFIVTLIAMFVLGIVVGVISAIFAPGVLLAPGLIAQ